MSLLDLEVIDLDVEIREGEVVKAKSSGNRLRDFDKVLIGKRADRLYDLLPRILATCSQSHILAYTQVGESTKEVTQILTLLEIIESHVKHPYIYWFPLIMKDKKYSFPHGERFKVVANLSREIKTLMERIGGKWPHTSYLESKSKVIIKSEWLKSVKDVFEKEIIGGMGLQEFLDLTSTDELKGDVRTLVDKGQEIVDFPYGLNKHLVMGFPFNYSGDPRKIEDKGLEVLYEGEKVEVGPLAQALTFDNLIRRYYYKHGPSPWLRELARLRVAGKLLLTLSNLDLEIDSQPFMIKDGKYISYLESIRGSLIHTFEINKGLVTSYRILQPTTFIAQPGGALEKSLEGIKISKPEDPVEIMLTVSSLDTCFITRVNVYNNGKLVVQKRVGGFC